MPVVDRGEIRNRVPLVAAIRLLLIVVVALGFFLVGVPLQGLVARHAPGLAHRIPGAFCRVLLRLAKVTMSVEGVPPEPQAALCVANHLSWIDILALGTVGPFCFLAKSEIASWPIASAFAAVQGTVFVERGRRRTILEANRRLSARLRQGRAVLLFPEGTTTAGPQPGRFLSSHFAIVQDRLAPARTPVPVQPIAIAFSSDAAAWIGDETLLRHLWRTLRGPPLACVLRFGAPVAAGRSIDRKALARNMRAAVVDLLEGAPSRSLGRDAA